MSELCRLVKKEEIPLKKRIWVRLFGRYPAFKADPHGLGITQYFYGHCSKHGYYVDYPHGYEEEIVCPACEETRLKERLKQQNIS